LKGAKPDYLETATDEVIKEISEGNSAADDCGKFRTQKLVHILLQK
jgi:hypothetical protein